MNLVQAVKAIRNGMDRNRANYGELRRMIRLARDVDSPHKTLVQLAVTTGKHGLRWAIVRIEPFKWTNLTYRFLLS